MKIEKIEVGPLYTNCYFLKKDNHLIVIDPGDDFEKIKNNIKNFVVDGIIVTHYHFDHVGALVELKKYTNAKVYDFKSLKEGNNQIGNFTFEMIRTPGHKEDLISIYFKEEKALFCGDFIFENSIGRTDLEGGNFKEMQKSIERILKYPDDIKIYPGHGNSTTLLKEKRNLESYL
jgi:glyoxylase-like metal-dependent hydrolase (beta-lactamase superfamily II)